MKYYYLTCLLDVAPYYLLKQSLIATSWSTNINVFSLHEPRYKTIPRHFIPMEDMLANFLSDLLRKYLYQVTNMYGWRALKFLSKIQDGLRQVFMSVCALVFLSVKQEFGLTTFWRLAAHALILAWRCVLTGRTFLCASVANNWMFI